ncbi:MAG: hypothetical protein HYV07_20010 [Deltaproteobacteria bacterium]|nr:hypothetical protein [Deltaproteobacteria bacterium]
MGSLVVLISTLAVSAAQLGAPDRLITKHGVELSADGRVFALFAALNGLGYSEETEHKGPPLSAPVFHELREKAREAIRPLAAGGKLDALKQTFERSPAEIDAYLALVFSYEPDLSKTATPLPEDLKGLEPAIGAIRSLSEDAELVKVFDQLSYEQRQFMKALMAGVTADFDQAASTVAAGIVAPVALTVVPNPLDAHGSVRRVRVGDRTFLVVGPGEASARRAILEEALMGRVEGPVKDALGKAGKLKKAYEALASSSKSVRAYGSAEAYVSATLARVLAFRVLTGTEDELIEREQQRGLAWTRGMLRATDAWKGAEPVVAEVSKCLAKINP